MLSLLPLALTGDLHSIALGHKSHYSHWITNHLYAIHSHVRGLFLRTSIAVFFLCKHWIILSNLIRSGKTEKERGRKRNPVWLNRSKFVDKMLDIAMCSLTLDERQIQLIFGRDIQVLHILILSKASIYPNFHWIMICRDFISFSRRKM